MEETIIKLAFENLRKAIDDILKKSNELDARLKEIESKMNSNNDGSKNKIKTWMFGA